MKLVLACAGALAVFLVYYACGGVAPFRDAGEFAVAASYLNVAHPPGYPFYTLLGKLWLTLLPAGNLAYRLNVLSALALAAAFLLLVFWLRRFFEVSVFAALAAAACLCSTRVILGLALVSEMYTVGLVWLVGLLLLVHESKNNTQALVLAGLVLPLALATRMDMALAAAYALPFLPSWFSRDKRRYLGAALLTLILGAAIFLYLPIRSNSVPWVNWGDPSSLGKLIGSLTRKSYGSTVDLLSLSYRSGELFWPDFGHWTRVAWETFGPLLALAPLGLYTLGRWGKLVPSLLCWLITGPGFLYLANMPPNPHAIKILEDHFLPSLVMVALWVGVGLDRMIKIFSQSLPGTAARKQSQVDSALLDSPRPPAGARNDNKKYLAAFAAFIAFIAFIAMRSFPWNLRRNFYAYDYAINVFRSAPPGSALVLHEDVQLFSTWEAMLNRGKRRDIRLAAQGLTGSPWYQKCLRERWGYRDFILGEKLENPQAWESFVGANSHLGMYAGFETDIPSGRISRKAEGLLNKLCLDGTSACVKVNSLDLWPFLVLRGSWRSDAERFFFNRDLIEDYSRAVFDLGNSLAREDQGSQGLRFMQRALIHKPLSPQASIALAYHAFLKGEWSTALHWWQRSRDKLGELLRLSNEYHTLAEVAGPFHKDLAYVLTSMGVTEERLGKSLGSVVALHQEALGHDFTSVIAHYNLAATFWRMHDANSARREFEEVVKLDPNHTEALKFLALLNVR